MSLDRFDFRAYTFSYGNGVSDGEPHHAALVAESLNIPIYFIAADKYPAVESWDDLALHTPEPINRMVRALRFDALNQAAACGRVLLTGYGADPALYPSYGYFVDLAKKFRFGQMASGVWGYWRIYGRRPPLYFGTYLRKGLGARTAQSPYPAWLNRTFVDRFGLRARWEQAGRRPLSVHPSRAEAYISLADPMWPHRFVNMDAGVTRIPLETRYPFFDVRLVAYLLRMPPVPWFVHKHLLRSAMLGALPEAVRTRPKAFFPWVAGDLPTRELVQGWVRDLEKTPAIAAWVDVDEYRRLADRLPDVDPAAAESVLRPSSLARWLWLDRYRVSLSRAQI